MRVVHRDYIKNPLTMAELQACSVRMRKAGEKDRRMIARVSEISKKGPAPGGPRYAQGNRPYRSFLPPPI